MCQYIDLCTKLSGSFCRAKWASHILICFIPTKQTTLFGGANWASQTICIILTSAKQSSSFSAATSTGQKQIYNFKHTQ